MNTIQPPPAPIYNHPRGDLLEGERRSEYLSICVPLYKASLSGDWEDAERILENRVYLVRYSITENKETALHIAVAAQNTNFVEHLVSIMANDDLKLQNGEGNTAFCLAAVAGQVRMAEIMFEKNNEVLTIRGSENMMPLCLAAVQGIHDMVTYLYDKSQQIATHVWTNDDWNSVFLQCIETDLFDVALQIFNDHENTLLLRNYVAWNVLHILVRKPNAFNDVQDNFSRIINPYLAVLRLKVRQTIKESEATLLLRIIWKKIVEKPKDEIDVILRGPHKITIFGEYTYPSQILFVAAEMGNIKFLVELSNEYPDLIWKKNDKGQSIFHIGVFYRQESIYNLLHELGSMKDTVTRLTDREDNNLLHSVAMNVGKSPHEYASGAAFQMQRELLWFKEVEAMIPPRLREMENYTGLTPSELFTDNHRGLVSEGEKWIKQTINQSMVAAALISTIGFSAAFTIPGGYDQNNGFPILLKSKAFKMFVVSDGISFILSSISILAFLSIMVSRYDENDFLESLPNKMMIGQATLFLSIFFVMIAFSASFFVLYHNSWLIIIGILAIIPVMLFTKQQYRLLLNAIRSTYNPMYMFRPKKRMLYNRNPRF